MIEDEERVRHEARTTLDRAARKKTRERWGFSLLAAGALVGVLCLVLYSSGKRDGLEVAGERAALSLQCLLDDGTGPSCDAEVDDGTQPGFLIAAIGGGAVVLIGMGLLMSAGQSRRSPG
ncbi:MAG: hypothetical protein H0V29_03925 [Thermoleophilaceae bacterium]|nr:hypothetical protein [Thermoleophilaceae bacterium]